MDQKTILLLLFLLSFGCQNKKKSPEDKAHGRIHEEMEIVDKEFQKFELKLRELYKEANANKISALQKAEQLIEKIKRNPDPNNLRWNKLGDLYNLRAELFYRLGDYNRSIEEIRKDQENNRIAIGVTDLGADGHNSLACNYIRLKDYNKAKVHLDSAGKGYYLADYLQGNYYEIKGNKKEALKTYNEIKKDKQIKHYVYYGLAIKRINELNKKDSKLLDELYYPPSDPDFDIADSDNENRDKIFKGIAALQEVKNCTNCGATLIFEDPQISDKDFYWIKVGNYDAKNNYKGDLKNFSTVFDFFFYPKNSELKVYDEKNKKVLTLAEWRKY
jgi:tetratricopeptide (TPR) repeat protein